MSSRKLPEEMIETILSWLPVKSISRFRCVNKYWCYNLFQKPDFIKLHLKHAIQMNEFNLLVSNLDSDASISTKTYLYSVDHHNILSSLSTPFLGQAVGIEFPFMSRKCAPHILGSCNGLVCIESYRGKGNIFISNPCTKEYKQIPNPIDTSVVTQQEDFLTTYGFGYDCKTEDYKLLRIVNEGEFSEARVYTLGSNAWRAIGVIPYNFSFGKNGHLLSGFLHWIVFRTGNELSGVIVSFDISNETFFDLPLPNDYTDEDPFMSELGMWEGKLCILRRNYKEHSKLHVDVWIMSDNTWSKHLSIATQLEEFYYGRPFQSLRNREILLIGGKENEGIGLISYDTKLEETRVIKVGGFPEYFELETYIGSLVSVNSGNFSSCL